MAKSSGTAADRRPDGMPVGTPFPKGKSGNPAGRAPGISFRKELENLAALVIKGEINPLTDLPEDMPVNRKIALNLIMKAVADGDLAAIKEYRDSIGEKPAQAVNLGGQGEDNPIQNVFTLKIDNS